MAPDDSNAQPAPDRTIVIPTPGAHASVQAATRTAAPFERVELGALDWKTGLNPLVAAANPLLGLVPRLRQAHHPDPLGLRETLARAVSLFELKAAENGVAHEALIAARYALCTFLDEAAANTPWGEKVWAQRSLLVQFHNEAWGGEKFFVLLGKLAERPAEHRQLLELFYLILALGFEGRFRVLDNGRAQLAGVRERLARLLAQERGPAEPALASEWRTSSNQAAPLRERLPLWVSAAVVALGLALVYVGLSFTLNQKSDSTFSAILALRAKTPLTAATASSPPASAPTRAPDRLAHFLADEIAAGTVGVQDLADRSIVIARGDTLFEAGSATVAPGFARLLERIGSATAQIHGSVLVRGHTDDRPIRSVRFPSNWHLSQARADTVAQLLRPALGEASRVRTEGRADSEPVASNATAEGRASNRRVEIIVFPAASSH